MPLTVSVGSSTGLAFKEWVSQQVIRGLVNQVNDTGFSLFPYIHQGALEQSLILYMTHRYA